MGSKHHSSTGRQPTSHIRNVQQESLLFTLHLYKRVHAPHRAQSRTSRAWTDRRLSSQGAGQKILTTVRAWQTEAAGRLGPVRATGTRPRPTKQCLRRHVISWVGTWKPSSSQSMCLGFDNLPSNDQADFEFAGMVAEITAFYHLHCLADASPS